jgi:hypothetical protein
MPGCRERKCQLQFQADAEFTASETTRSRNLNLQEHVWDEIREKEFPNRVFDHLDGVIQQLQTGLPRLAADHDGLRSLTNWPWIDSLNLNAK